MLQPISPQEAAILERAKRRLQSLGSLIPGARVRAMLKKLDHLQQTGEVTQEQVQELLRKVKSGRPL